MSLHFILQGYSSLAHTLTYTRSLIFQGLVLFGQRCVNRRCNTSPDSSQKQGGGDTLAKQTANPESQRERWDFSGFTETHAKTHTHAHLHTVCVTVAFIWGLGPLATFLNVCLSSLKTEAAAGVNISQQAVHRLLLSSVIFYYLIKKQEIRFPLSEKGLILLSQSNLSWEREMERGAENGGETCGEGVSEWEWLTVSSLPPVREVPLSLVLFFFSFCLTGIFTTHRTLQRLGKRVCIRHKLFLLLLILFPPLPSSFHIVLHRGRATIISLFMIGFVFWTHHHTHTLPSSQSVSHLSFRTRSFIVRRPYNFICRCVWHMKRWTSAVLVFFHSDSSALSLKMLLVILTFIWQGKQRLLCYCTETPIKSLCHDGKVI